ncbi:MAG: insulinase family protein [Kiloniellales bacterium]|nr:insulinase family protein [Kiloniellales bacterium]
MTVQVTRLENGLTIASDRIDGVETAALGAWVGVGTRHEAAEVNGVAHLLEHMAFKGTARRNAQDIAEEIEAVGGHLNAYTSRENTAYYARVLADDVPLAVDIIADILQHPSFDEGELAREREVVLQEIGQAHDTPDDIVFDHFQETAYPGQALGRPVLGRAEVVRGLGRDTLVDYLARHYRGPNLVIAAAGRVDHDRFVALAGEAFGGLPAEAERPDQEAHYRGGEYREERDLEQVHLVIGLPAMGIRDPAYYTLSVLSTLFGGGMSSRLFQEVREKRGLVYSIYSFTAAFTDGGVFGIYAGTGAAQVGELVPLVGGELRRLAEDAGAAEVARAKAQLKASILMGRESTGARCEQLAQQLLIYGRPLPVEEIVAEIDAIDVAAVRELAARLAAGRPTLASLGPLNGARPFEDLARSLA